jgi:hypothetical protein
VCEPQDLSKLVQNRSALNELALPALDFLCNEVSKVCHQCCCLIDIFHFYNIEYDRLLGTSDFLQAVFQHYSLMESIYLELSFIKATDLKEIISTKNYAYYSSIDDFCFLLDKVRKRSYLALEISYWKKFLTQLIVSLFPGFLYYYFNPIGDNLLLQTYLNSALLFLEYLKATFKNDVETMFNAKAPSQKIAAHDFSQLYSDFLRQYYRTLYGKLIAWFESNCLENFQVGLTKLFSLSQNYYSVASKSKLFSEAAQVSKCFSEDAKTFLIDNLQHISVSRFFT